LIKQVYFPREVFPTAIAAFRFSSLCLSMIIIVPYMIYENILPSKMILLLPIAMFSCTLLGQGLGMMAAVIQVRIRDLKQVIDLLVRAGFFLSGVFFGAEIIPEKYLGIYLLNPIAVYIEMARGGILGEWGVLNFWVISRSVFIALLFFYIGTYVFMRFERKAVKYI
jgi:lipopolysaccharide transport system permease protein